MSTEKISGPGERTAEDVRNLMMAQTGNRPAWESPLQARTSELGTILIPADLAARAAFLAQVDRGALSGRRVRK